MTPTIEAPVQTPVEPTSPLSLSEALRLGAMTSEQAFGTFSDPSADTPRFCALGTIWYALGLSGDPGSKGAEWEFLTAKVDVSPITRDCCPTEQDCLWAAIVHLNDEHRMPRDEIASRLERVGL